MEIKLGSGYLGIWIQERKKAVKGLKDHCVKAAMDDHGNRVRGSVSNRVGITTKCMIQVVIMTIVLCG